MSEVRDYYETLGVSRDATADEIRKAYRRMAREHHPDLHRDDPGAADRFKVINQAYEVLSDDEKRARYDRFGAGGVDGDGGGGGAGAGGFGPFGDIFDVFFGAGGRAQQADTGPERGSDLRYDLEMTLEEVLHGASKTLTIPRMEHCSECGGNGAKPGTKPQPCVTCAGAGYVRTTRQTMLGVFSQMAECYRCHGRGVIVTDPCPRCRGRGQERRTRELTLEIPPGVDERTRIRRTGEGEAGPYGGPPGDLYVFIGVRNHPKFERDGRDLSSTIQVSFARAALGGQVEVPTLEGVETLTIPEGTQSGDEFRLRGKGLPELNRPTLRGDQLVTVCVRTPTSLNDRQRTALRELAEAGGEDLAEIEKPREHEGGIFEWVRNLFTGHQSRDD